MEKYRWVGGVLFKKVDADGSHERYGGLYERVFPWSLIHYLKHYRLIKAVREGAKHAD